MPFTKLVILPCHSIWTPGPSLGQDKLEWALAHFQLHGNDHLCFKEHISRCLTILETDPLSYLVISGGQTKKECGPVSELYTYYQLAKRMWQGHESLFDRITIEEFARDSFENVIFLICRFYELHKYYPSQVCIVGFEFKRSRFLDLHLNAALRFPIGNVEYHGNDPSPTHMTEIEKKQYFDELKESEMKYAFNPFSCDLYGLTSTLSIKRNHRNPFSRFHGYATSNPQLADFIHALTGHLKKHALECLPENMPWM